MNFEKFKTAIQKHPVFKHTISRNGAILGGFALVTTLLISLTHWLTSPIIELQLQNKTLSLIEEVLPGKYWNNDITQNCTAVYDGVLGPGNHRIYRAWLDDKPSALVIESTTPNGYSGNIKFLVSLVIREDEGTELLGGVRVLEHKETPGLGDKIELRVSDWILTFTDRVFAETQNDDWAVKKDGGKFDQFTGATITPRAVIAGIQNAVTFAENEYQALFNAPNDCLASEESQVD